jgi:hypothetical protein
MFIDTLEKLLLLLLLTEIGLSLGGSIPYTYMTSAEKSVRKKLFRRKT